MDKLFLKDKYRLPDSIKVQLIKSKGSGYTIILPEYSGLVTYAEDVSELISVVNDAVLTYFEVPTEEAKRINFLYVPDPVEFHNLQQESGVKKKKESNPVTNFVTYSPVFSYA